MELSKRKNKILCAVIEHYIQTGEPIGSKVLLEKLDISVSSATIRNEMSELAEIGLLEQTHISSGRIPTHKGYRYYIDKLMADRTLDDAQKRRIDLMVGKHFNNPEKLLIQAGLILADITDCAVITSTPTDESALIVKIELIPVSKKTAIVALLTSTGILKSRVCRTDVELTPEMTHVFYKIISENFIGKSVSEIGKVILQNLVVSFDEYSLAMTPIIVTLSELAQEIIKAEILLEGQTNLLNYREFGNNVYEIMEFLRRTEPLTDLLLSRKKPIDVLIGKENPYEQLENSSIIISGYKVNGFECGSLGVIGPTRMDYASLVPRVRYLTDLVSKLLSQTLDN